MRSKKLLTIVTGIITIVSFPLLFVISHGTVAYDIDLAFFGSAVLSFIMSFSEYLVARREAMEDFFKEFLKLKNEILKYPPIKISMPLNMFQKILLEEWNNEDFYIPGIKRDTKARDEYKRWRLNGGHSHSSIDKDVDVEIAKQVTLAKQTAKDYDRVINTEAFQSAWGRIDFFDRPYQKHVYEKLYKPLIDVVGEFDSNRIYLHYFSTGETKNLPVAFKYCVDDSVQIYRRKETDESDRFFVQCEENLSPQLDAPLLEFWIKMYHPSKQQIDDEKKNYSGKSHSIWSAEIGK